MPISTLPYRYFTASWISFSLDVDALNIIWPNGVPCFTTSSTVMLDVFPTGVSTTMFEVLFISYKLLIALRLYPRFYISIRQSFSNSLSKHFLTSAKNIYVLFLYCPWFSVIEFKIIRRSTVDLCFLPGCSLILLNVFFNSTLVYTFHCCQLPLLWYLIFCFDPVKFI